MLDKILGTCLLLVALFLFITFTGSINEPYSMGGPMNLMPVDYERCAVVLVADVIWVLMAWGGAKLVAPDRRVSGRLVGWLFAVAGSLILMLAITNHINSPPLEGYNDMDKFAVPFELHLLAYIIVGMCLIISIVFIGRSKGKSLR